MQIVAEQFMLASLDWQDMPTEPILSPEEEEELLIPGQPMN